MDYDETLKRLGLLHLKGNIRALMKAADEMMKRSPDYHPLTEERRDMPREPRGMLSTVVGRNEEGEPLYKVHLTSDQRKLLEQMRAEIEALPDDED